MNKAIQLIIAESLAKEYENNEENLAMFITGSVARGEATEVSDLDLILVTKTKEGFEEFEREGILVEIKSNTLAGFTNKMNEKPMSVYQFLDAKVLFDKANIYNKLLDEAKQILKNFMPDVEGTIKWLESVKTKIESASIQKNKLSLGFNTSNVLWMVVQGIYFVNKMPTPPSTTALKQITTLKRLPNNFDELWSKVLIGNLEERSKATVELINFTLSKLKKL